MKHVSVLLNEAVDGLNIKPDGVYVDATVGYGGHSEKILQKLKKGKLFAFDQDIDAINYVSEKFKDYDNFTLIHSNFSNIKEELERCGISKVDGILFDLGVSSPQIDDGSRGFSFMKDAELDMRMNRENELNAKTVINEYSLESLVDIFYRYGEEKFSKPIAKKIIDSRPINTTLELVDVITSAVPVKYAKLNHPERRIFQAIRIEVNKELNVLDDTLNQAVDLLNSGGRISVITFHSLEDRITKQIFNKYSKIDDLVKGLPEIPEQYIPKIKLINKKPILPTIEEMSSNARSKSAKLRIVERI